MGIFKYLTGLAAVLILRLMPHPPNVEPIMASSMPFAKKWGWFFGALFTASAMLYYDLLTSTLGMWSFVTISTYVLITIAASLYLKNKENKVKYYVGFAVIATLVYDAITGVVMGTLLFKQPLWLTITGQIPFTLYHLAGNIVLSAIISPLLYRWVADNPQLETDKVIEKVKSVFTA